MEFFQTEVFQWNVYCTMESFVCRKVFYTVLSSYVQRYIISSVLKHYDSVDHGLWSTLGKT